MSGSPLAYPKELRARWFLQADKYHQSIKDVCSVFGISRKTYYKWYQLDHGLSKTVRRPRKIHPHTKIFGETQVLIVNTKLKYNYGPKKMSIFLNKTYNLKISHQAIYKFYQKKKLIRKPQKKLKWYTPLKQPYLANLAGENVQLDVKYVPGPNQTWEYQYRFLDTVSNLQFMVNMLHRDSLTTITALRQAIKYFPFTIAGIQTDNGGEFRGFFHYYLINHNISHRYIPKRSAPWNGKVERANRSIDDEYYLNLTKPWKTLNQYLHWFNYERPHLGQGMSGMTPYEKYLSLA